MDECTPLPLAFQFVVPRREIPIGPIHAMPSSRAAAASAASSTSGLTLVQVSSSPETFLMGYTCFQGSNENNSSGGLGKWTTVTYNFLSGIRWVVSGLQ